MSSKRKAAAELFREQNIVQMADIDFDESNERLAEEESETSGFQRQEQSPPPQAHRARMKPAPPPLTIQPTSEELQMEKEPIRVRETRILFWRWVVVPPNVYVVHTRSGRTEPVTLGLGISFRYRPATDSYLVVPAAMQTIGIVANCITREKQGVNVLAYVQWQIANFRIAYRKLDFSDSRDPLGIVNAQLREQAEAAIKDKIATMSVEEVLTDKAPIIEELTTRLKAVSEGRSGGEAVDEGLGIKIVTVQVKEAIISSQRLWENLQAPFRHQQEQAARMSYLNMEEQIRQRELEARQLAETSEAQTTTAIERARQISQTETHQARLEADQQRYQIEVDSTMAKLEEESRLQQARLEAEQAQYARQMILKQVESDLSLMVQRLSDALEITRLMADLERQKAADEQRLALLERETEIERIQQEIRNLANDQDLMARLIEHLPELAASLPEVAELRVLQTGGEGGYDALAGFIMNMQALLDALGIKGRLAGQDGAEDQ